MIYRINIFILLDRTISSCWHLKFYSFLLWNKKTFYIFYHLSTQLKIINIAFNYINSKERVIHYNNVLFNNNIQQYNKNNCCWLKYSNETNIIYFKFIYLYFFFIYIYKILNFILRIQYHSIIHWNYKYLILYCLLILLTINTLHIT